MIKFVFILLMIFTVNLFPEAVAKYYNNWKVKNIVYEGTDTKTVTITMSIDDVLDIYIASRENQVNITFTWYNEQIDDKVPVVQYSFDNSNYYSIEPVMRSSKDNFDILFTISPELGLVQENEMINFFKNLASKKTLSIRPNDYGQSYEIDLEGFKQAIEETDFSGTLLDKYKARILN